MTVLYLPLEKLYQGKPPKIQDLLAEITRLLSREERVVLGEIYYQYPPFRKTVDKIVRYFTGLMPCRYTGVPLVLAILKACIEEFGKENRSSPDGERLNRILRHVLDIGEQVIDYAVYINTPRGIVHWHPLDDSGIHDFWRNFKACPQIVLRDRPYDRTHIEWARQDIRYRLVYAFFDSQLLRRIKGPIEGLVS